MVEPHVANVIVAGSSPVSRSIKGGIAKRLRQRSAKPLFIGSNPIAASNKIKDLANIGKSFFIGKACHPCLLDGRSFYLTVGSISWGCVSRNSPFSIQSFSMFAISRALTYEDTGIAAISWPLRLIVPLFNSP